MSLAPRSSWLLRTAATSSSVSSYSLRSSLLGTEMTVSMELPALLRDNVRELLEAVLCWRGRVTTRSARCGGRGWGERQGGAIVPADPELAGREAWPPVWREAWPPPGCSLTSDMEENLTGRRVGEGPLLASSPCLEASRGTLPLSLDRDRLLCCRARSWEGGQWSQWSFVSGRG